MPIARTFNILENILKKHVDANQILKQRKKQMLSGEDYNRIKVDLNNKLFLQPVDAEDTKANIYYIKQK